MKDQYTYEVGDSVLLIGEEEAVCPDTYGEVIYVDLTYAIVRLRCRNEWERKWAMELYQREGGQDETIEKDKVLSLLGKDYDCGEYDLFFDKYTSFKWGYKTPQYYPISVLDNNGNELPYYDIKDSDWIAYCGLQSVDQIRYFKLFGEAAPGYEIFPLTENELNELGLSPEGNYFKGTVVYPKELIQGVWADVEINEVRCDGDIVYSHGNKAVIKSTPFHDENFNSLEVVSFNDLKQWPGTADLFFEEDSPGYDYVVFDQITGETEEQFKSMEVIADDGTVLTGEIRGYRYMGRKIVGRYLCFNGEEDSATANRLFADRTEDNKFMCQKIDYDSTYYYFCLSENEAIEILH